MKTDLLTGFFKLLFRHRKPVQVDSLDPDSIETIAVLSNTAIGDTLFATPAFRSLKKHFPGKKLIAVLNPKNATLFETNPHLDEIIPYDGRWGSFLKTANRLKKEKIDLALILHSNEPQATPLCLMAGMPQIIKLPNDKNPWKAFHVNPPAPRVPDRHGIFDRLAQLAFLGIDEQNPRMELFLTDTWKAEASSWLQAHTKQASRLIGFQPGASTLSRMWFPEKWIALGKKLLGTHPDTHIVLTGAPHEKPLCQEIRKGIGDSHVVDASGALNLGSAAALIGRLNLLVAPDTGPLHIAAALGVPTVGLFAVADPVKSNPCYDSGIHPSIKKPLTCDPCLAKRCRYQKCMLQIESDEVFDKIIQFIYKKK